MRSEVLLDVRELAAPEPLERVMTVLPSLAPGQFLHVVHRQQAHCLCGMLAGLGYEHAVDDGGAGRFDIWIWRAVDQTAALAVQHNRPS